MSVKSGRRTGKRLLSFLLGLCMMIGLMPLTAMAADQPSYVVLGDSISTGYGLAEGEPFFAEQLAEKNNPAMSMLAEVGATSQDLCNVVNSTDNE